MSDDGDIKPVMTMERGTVFHRTITRDGVRLAEIALTLEEGLKGPPDNALLIRFAAAKPMRVLARALEKEANRIDPPPAEWRRIK